MARQIVSARPAELALATGVRLRYLAAGDPAGPPVIMLHGYTDSSFSFSPVLPLLPRSWHLLALDQRGHGDSGRPQAGYAMADFAADVLAFADALDLPRAVLVGHSMGALVALETALRAPERVAGLALLGGGPAMHHLPVISELKEAVDALGDPVPYGFAEEFQASTTCQPMAPEFLSAVVEESLKLPARVWRAALDGQVGADFTVRLPRIAAPALLLWGEQDTIFGRAEQEALCRGLARAELRAYPETGHAIHWERPGRVASDLRAFVEGLA